MYAIRSYYEADLSRGVRRANGHIIPWMRILLAKQSNFSVTSHPGKKTASARKMRVAAKDVMRMSDEKSRCCSAGCCYTEELITPYGKKA